MSGHASPQACSRCNPLLCSCRCHAVAPSSGVAVGRIEFCWVGRGNRSVWPTEEEARRDAVEMKQDGARIQRRRVVISEWEDVDDE